MKTHQSLLTVATFLITLAHAPGQSPPGANYNALYVFGSSWAVATLEGHKEAVTQLAFTPDGDHLVSVSKDQLRVWRAASWAETDAREGGRKMSVAAVMPRCRPVDAAGFGLLRAPQLWSLAIWRRVASYSRGTRAARFSGTAARPARRATRPAGHTRRLAAFGFAGTLGSHDLNWAGRPMCRAGRAPRRARRAALPENPGALAPGAGAEGARRMAKLQCCGDRSALRDAFGPRSQLRTLEGCETRHTTKSTHTKTKQML